MDTERNHTNTMLLVGIILGLIVHNTLLRSQVDRIERKIDTLFWLGGSSAENLKGMWDK